MLTKRELIKQTGEQDGAAAARKIVDPNNPNKTGWVYDYYEHAEKYGYVPVGRTRPMRNIHRNAWAIGFGNEQYKIFREAYRSVTEGSRAYMQQNLEIVTWEEGIALQELLGDEFRLWIECDVCGAVRPYAGYPPVPNVSTVLCMTCGVLSPAGKKYVPKEHKKLLRGQKNDNLRV